VVKTSFYDLILLEAEKRRLKRWGDGCRRNSISRAPADLDSQRKATLPARNLNAMQCRQ
jgi:hypothetical protein